MEDEIQQQRASANERRKDLSQKEGGLEAAALEGLKDVEDPSEEDASNIDVAPRPAGADDAPKKSEKNPFKANRAAKRAVRFSCFIVSPVPCRAAE